MAILTDRVLATGATLQDLIHIVITGDTSQNPAGSSYKATIGQLLPLFGGSSGNCITDLYITNLHGCSPITVWDSIQSFGSTASGDGSFAFGVNNIASGDGSFAEGIETIATNTGSHAEGFQTVSVGLRSHTEGFATSAITTNTHAEGFLTLASGVNSHAEGELTIASGLTSHAEGFNTQSLGDYSHAEGVDTIAIGIGSHVEGSDNEAVGLVSHAEGGLTQAIGQISHAEGLLTQAIGSSSHAQGSLTRAIGDSSHAGGSGTLLSSTVIAEGNTSFIHMRSTGGGLRGVRGNFSAILGGLNNDIYSGATSSVILGGEDNVVISGATNSIVLGGQGITGSTLNTVYVPDFVIKKSAAVPVNSADPIGEEGSVTWDNTHFYWKTATGWLRVLGSSF
jgi:hypothetical protein